MKKFYFLAGLMSAVCFSGLLAQSPGSLDLTFNGTGKALLAPFGASAMENAQDAVVLSDGKILFCGTSSIGGDLNISVVKVNQNGSIDNTFGTNGTFVHPSAVGADFAFDMEVLPDGRILVAGAISITAANTKATVVCLTPSGALDMTFGTGGIFSTDLDPGEDYMRQLLMDDNGITVVGNVIPSNSFTERIGMLRIDYNGQLIPGFGNNGVKIFTTNNFDLSASSAIVLPGGDIIVAGSSVVLNQQTFVNSYFPFVAKFDQNGSAYANFGINGVYQHTTNGRYFDVEFNGTHIIAFGNDQDNNVNNINAIMRSHSITNGSVVGSFGNLGTTVVSLNPTDTFMDAIIHPDGKILACGTTGAMGFFVDRNFLVSRFNASGSIDLAWGINGNAITTFGTGFEDANALHLTNDNKVVAVGFSQQTNNDFALARYYYSSAVPGCTNPLACNYNPAATEDNGSCLVTGAACDDGNANTTNDVINANCICEGTPVIPGCTDPLACNFDPEATQDNGSCLMTGTACDDGNANTANDIINANCICEGTPVIPGCTDPHACNFNSEATEDNGSCLVMGQSCDDGNADTANDMINVNCICEGTQVIPGCTDPDACNFNPEATEDNGSCLMTGATCDDGNANTTDDMVDENCECNGTLIIPGCTSEDACNYNPDANEDDGLCQFPGDYCSDNDPFTFDDIWTSDCDCIGIPLVFGCMNGTACNYNPEATQTDGSCVFPGSPCDDNNPETFNDVYNDDCDCLGSTSVHELSTLDFVFYPNPTAGNITIRWEFPDTYNLRIHDLSGRLVMAEDRLNGTQERDLSGLSSGAYVLIISSGGSQAVKPLIKQ